MYDCRSRTLRRRRGSGGLVEVHVVERPRSRRSGRAVPRPPSRAARLCRACWPRRRRRAPGRRCAPTSRDSRADRQLPSAAIISSTANCGRYRRRALRGTRSRRAASRCEMRTRARRRARRAARASVQPWPRARRPYHGSRAWASMTTARAPARAAAPRRTWRGCRPATGPPAHRPAPEPLDRGDRVGHERRPAVVRQPLRAAAVAALVEREHRVRFAQPGRRLAPLRARPHSPCSSSAGGPAPPKPTRHSRTPPTSR